MLKSRDTVEVVTTFYCRFVRKKIISTELFKNLLQYISIRETKFAIFVFLCHGSMKRNYKNMTMKELESCIDAYGKDIYTFCLHLTKDRELADDLYQDTFLTAIQKQDGIDDNANVKSYLLSICLHIWKNKKRKWAWRNRIAPMTRLEDAMDNGFSYIESDCILKNEKTVVVRKAIENLSDKYRIVVLLFYMEELSQDEIANVLRVPVGTVKSRLHTAKQLLKSELEEYFNG